MLSCTQSVSKRNKCQHYQCEMPWLARSVGTRCSLWSHKHFVRGMIDGNSSIGQAESGGIYKSAALRPVSCRYVFAKVSSDAKESIARWVPRFYGLTCVSGTGLVSVSPAFMSSYCTTISERITLPQPSLCAWLLCVMKQ
jgi:hypothetical protein